MKARNFSFLPSYTIFFDVGRNWIFIYYRYTNPKGQIKLTDTYATFVVQKLSIIDLVIYNAFIQIIPYVVVLLNYFMEYNLCGAIFMCIEQARKMFNVSCEKYFHKKFQH